MPVTKLYYKIIILTIKICRVADGTLAFMFESSLLLKVTKWAHENNIDDKYYTCWQGLQANFNYSKSAEEKPKTTQ